MQPFATLEDYEARWDAPPDTERVEVLLSDASAYLARLLQRKGVSVDPDDELQAASLTRITCRLAHDSVGRDDLPGVTQSTWSAQPYSQTLTFANPSGKFFLYRDEKAELGIAGGRVGTVPPKRWL